MCVSRTVIWLIFGLFSLVVGLSVLWVSAVSLGYFPTLGGNHLHFQAFEAFCSQSHFFSALTMTVFSALLSTGISVVLSFGLLAVCAERRIVQKFSRLLAPILAVPHSLLAVAVIVLFAPTGWVVRMFWSFTAQPDIPPQYHFAPDSFGIGLILALVMKETAFLLLMLLGHLGNARYHAEFRLARALGYHPVAAWLKVIAPQVYPKVRLPILAILIFSAANVEVALVTNSFDAPTLSILILRLFAHPDLGQLFPAAAGSILLLLVCLGLILFWWLGEVLFSVGFRRFVCNGKRYFCETVAARTIATVFIMMLAVMALGLLFMVLQAVSFRWAFPDLLPESWIFSRPHAFARNLALDVVWDSIMIGLGSTLFSLILALAGLLTIGARGQRFLSLWVYVPLILPQIALMMGVQLLLIAVHAPPSLLVVILVHSLFVLPYVYLTLAGAYQRFDMRYTQVARSLRAGFWWRLCRVILPMTLRPLLAAFAIGFAVSMAQYLATLLAAKGQIGTVMTQFMLSVSGGNPREVAQMGLVLLILVAIPFWVATGLPNFLFRNRRGMHV